MEPGNEAMPVHSGDHYPVGARSDMDASMIHLIKEEQNTILPAPYFYVVHDYESSELLYVSPAVEELYGISRDSIMDGNQHLFFEIAFEDEKPTIKEFAKSIWDKHYNRGSGYLSGRVFTIEYHVKTLKGDNLHIMHQNEVYTYTETDLPKKVVARFVDLSWLIGKKEARFVKLYSYDRRTNKIEHYKEKRISQNYKPGLTYRECEIQRLINKGCTSREIAGRLKISVETVKTHRRNIKAKRSYDHSQ